ncbi:MAG: endo alpha-1,4 polygalactosaminidase [Gracilimonas sp.]|uniref:endo alpha-1,4 polygalactosaminidase n=1 Tax=Gracilimonas sp. TaxID=1974203 RepID=UPI003753BCCD|nr:endo alpha-1,4 polygalactosaminidase [Gracilimonas sp.]
MRTNLIFLLLIILTWFSCGNILSDPEDGIDYRSEMRSFVQEISSYAKDQDSDFVVIPQNGHQLLLDGNNIATSYLNAVDGLAQENLFFGYPEDNLPSSATMTNNLISLLNIGKQNGKTILITDYVSTPLRVTRSYSQNKALDFLSFAAPEHDLTVIPSNPQPLPGENSNNITRLSQAKNFLYLLNKSEFSDKDEFISAVENTNYDLLIIDAFYNGNLYTEQEIARLRQKRNGGTRMLISYMSIGEAEEYRYYWQDSWRVGGPEWLFSENPNWAGNYKVEYWNSDWQDIIYGDEDSYLQKIIDSGFDGVYLDIIDGFQFFE